MEPYLIFVSLGTHEQPFRRAIDFIRPLAADGQRLAIQHGTTPPDPTLPSTEWFEYMPFKQVVEAMTAADLVICHAGVGTIITALQSGHAPGVMARESRYGEHVDDHQHDIASRLAAEGLIRWIRSEGDVWGFRDNAACERRRSVIEVNRGLAVAVRSGTESRNPSGRGA